MKGSDYKGGRSGAAQGLNSPWDLALDRAGAALYVAMSGQHQIWKYDIRSGIAGEGGLGIMSRRFGHVIAGQHQIWRHSIRSGIAGRGAGLGMIMLQGHCSKLTASVW